MKKACALLLIITSTVLLCSAAFADYGARPMAMGGAFTAIADDANAAAWNPAGFAINPGVELKGTTLVDHRNESVGDNFAALKMCVETPMDSPFGWIVGVGAISALGLTAAQYLSDQGVLKKNWGRSGEKTSKNESMSEEVKKEDTGEQRSRNEIIGEGISRIFGGGKKTTTPEATTTPSPSPTTPVTIEKHYYHEPVYYGPVPFYNPGYSPDMHRPTYYEDREYATNPAQTPANKAQFALGITWMHDANASLDQDTNWYTFSLATAWEETVSLGSNLNLYDLSVPSINAKGIGAGLDFGILIRSYERIFLGLCAKEVLTTDIQWTNGAVTRYEMGVNAGAAIRPIKEITLAVDIHNIFRQNNEDATMHYGLEVIPLPGVALRCGLLDGNKTAGAGLKLGEIMLDYAILGGIYNRTQIGSLAWTF
jgi:hypothetical protein